MSQRTATKSVDKTTGTIDELRTALNQLTAADRRLRGRDHSRPGELTFAQIRTIAALGREHEMTAGQLAKSAELTPAAITAILDQLETANIVERRRSTADRRVCNVALTPEGWELLERKLAVWNAVWAERLSGFSDKDIATAAAILHEVTGILDSVASSLDSAEQQA
ncbi:MAG TPA: MarR family transcriptional regulator [Solirubrobacteraceae bacterium]|nr:MarR family transcriptional regulator [Solirubrobacteraceae bacterium]